MSKLNLFLPITPYTLSISENLIKNNIIDTESKNILINPHGLKYNKSIWDEVYIGNSSRKVYNNSFLKYLNFLKQIVVFCKINNNLKQYKNTPINFFYVDLAHVLSNSIFFNFKNIQSNSVLEDGVLNYYKLGLNGKMLSKNYINKLLYFFNLRTKKFQGDITGIEMKSVDSQYVYFPDYAYYPHKSIQIPYKKHSYDLNNRVLLLGQEPIINLISKDSYRKILKKIIQDIKKENKDFVLYYKAHHHGEKNLVKSFLSAELGRSLIYITDEKPIHEIVEKIKPSKVISFGSTASLNLKLILPQKVSSKVYILKNKDIPRNKNLENLFQKVNIQVLKVDCKS